MKENKLEGFSMRKRLNEEEKQKIVSLYAEGQSALYLCSRFGVSRGAIYSWIARYQKLDATGQSAITFRDYYDLKRHADMLEERLKVIKAAGCGTAAPLKEKLAALEALYGQYSVHALCDALDVSRGTFYNHIFRKKDVTAYDKRREEMRLQVKSVFEESRQRYGANKVCAVLAARGIRTTPKSVAELMREMGLYSVGADSKREHKKGVQLLKKQNLLQRKFNVSEPNRVWVSDVTCFEVKEKYLYICVIIDLFSRKVIAYRVSGSNSTYLITSTFKQAFKARSQPRNLTFHSDRGIQYASNAFQKLLRMNKVIQSFSNSGRPHDNAVAEAFFASMKKEELYRTNYKSEREFCESVGAYVRFYNAERPHRTLAYRTPDFIEAQYDKQNHVSFCCQNMMFWRMLSSQCLGHRQRAGFLDSPIKLFKNSDPHPVLPVEGDDQLVVIEKNGIDENIHDPPFGTPGRQRPRP
jgi:transposase InsO family protein